MGGLALAVTLMRLGLMGDLLALFTRRVLAQLPWSARALSALPSETAGQSSQ